MGTPDAKMGVGSEGMYATLPDVLGLALASLGDRRLVVGGVFLPIGRPRREPLLGRSYGDGVCRDHMKEVRP